MQTLVFAPMPKKSMYAVKLWEVPPPRDGQKSPYERDKALFGFIL